MPETTSHTTAADDASPAPPLFMASVDLTVLSPVQRGFVQVGETPLTGETRPPGMSRGQVVNSHATPP